MPKKSKRQVRLQREKAKQKKNKKMEKQDALGISRKKHRFEISFRAYFILKLIGIILIPLAYFLYSPLLALVVLYNIILYFFTYACENSLNKGVIKSNYIKIPKFDCAISLLTLMLGLYSAISNLGGRVGKFSNTILSKINNALTSLGTLQTGNRTLFGNSHRFKFGTMDKPEGFIPQGERPPMMDKPEFNIDDLPIEFMLNQIMSTVVTVCIFAIMIFGIISLIITYLKIKKFNKDMTVLEYDAGFTLNDEEIERILSFNVIEENDEATEQNK